MPRLLLALICTALVALAGCPNDETATPDPVGDVITLPDGQMCNAGELIECVEEGGVVAVYCRADGMSTELRNCPGDPNKTQCRSGSCETLPAGAICFRGEVLGCVAEGSKQAIFCNNSGTGTVEGVCVGDDGRDSQCRDGACTTCFPGDRRCEGDQLVVECQADGSGYEPYSQCNGLSQVCTGRVCEELCERNFKFNSYIGCDYWAADLDNAFVPGGGRGYYDALGAQYAVVVANPPDAPLDAVVEVFQKEGGLVEQVRYDSLGNLLPTEPLKPGELRVLRLPRRDVNGTVQAPLAYQVTSSIPIIAYQFNPLENENVFSNDASLLLPSSLVGRDYLVMTREQTFDTLRGFATIVAVMPGETVVSFDSSASTEAGVIYPGTPDEKVIPHMERGATKIFTLNQFDVLNIETDRPGEDLTGSRIKSNQRVVVYGGSEAANAPNTARCVDINPVTQEGVCEWDMSTSCRSLSDCVSAGFNTCCADHLEQQLFPIKIWGSSYIATKTWDRGQESDIYRIIAAEDNTTIRLIPPLPGINVPILDSGEWYEFESPSNFEIHAQGDKPIMVGQFLAAQDAPFPNTAGGQQGDAGTGDPAFMLAIPVEQYRPDFVVLVPAEYEDNYINITAPTGADVQLDGEEILPGSFTVIGSGEYSVYRQRLDPGTHTVQSTEPAGVLVYGYDQFVSYAYTGGLDLEDINKETPFSSGTDP